MFGLVILFFLGLWILITIIATVTGARKKGSKGAFIGFMLTMGGPIVYWTGEYVYIQHTVNQLCNADNGLTVYVTPEEYAQHLKDNNLNNIPRVEVVQADEVIFDKLIFNRDRPFSRVDVFSNYINYPNFFIEQRIYIDTNTNIVLMKFTSIHTFTFSQEIRGLMFWRTNLKDCDRHELIEYRNELIANYKGVVL